MQSVRLNEIYQQYSDDIQFFLIYIREAHAADRWQTPQNLYEDIIFDELRAIGGVPCMRYLPHYLHPLIFHFRDC